MIPPYNPNASLSGQLEAIIDAVNEIREWQNRKDNPLKHVAFVKEYSNPAKESLEEKFMLYSAKRCLPSDQITFKEYSDLAKQAVREIVPEEDRCTCGFGQCFCGAKANNRFRTEFLKRLEEL